MTTRSTARTAAAIFTGLAAIAYAGVAAAQAPPRSTPTTAGQHAREGESSMTFATAEEPGADGAPSATGEDTKKNRLSFGGGGGYGFGFVTHPDLVGNRFDGPILEFHATYSLRPAWTIGLEFMNFESQLKRIGRTDTFMSKADAQALHPQAGATKDADRNGPGGLITGLPLHLNTVGATVELTPMDYDGLYFGATLGAALLNGVSAKAGAALAARGGYRLRIVDLVALALEVGSHAQIFDEASAVVPFAELQLRLLFPR